MSQVRAKFSKRLFKRLKGIAILILILSAIGFGVRHYLESSKVPPVKFLTAEARSGDLRSVILATGKVQPVSLVSVGTQVSGTLKELYVDYNSEVKKGQLIALIDPQQQEADLAQTSAALAASEADVEEARANLLQASMNLSRSRELLSNDLIARSALEADETGLKTARARLDAALARVTQQRAGVERSKLQLNYTRIYSPVDGVVVTRNVSAGQTVAASFNTPTIAEIAEDLSRMQVEVNIDEADIGSVYENQRVEFTVDAFPDRAFEGSVTQIRLSPISESNVISYKAIVSFINEQVEGRNLIPGMTANVTLIVDEKKDVLMVPNAALRFRPPDDTEGAAVPSGGGAPMGRGRQQKAETAASGDVRRGSSVYTLEQGKPVRVGVTSGITNGADTEVLSGLEAGAEVVVGIDVPRDA
ncbi:MAG: efflux RND transporter periplasmic adaptor subunit [Synergistaceae bacterium]|jgi:HlyD family secretion protein|nr:efflux RND transporter periplasmic adaptor subunit [Synergistaceae bacterium]